MTIMVNEIGNYMTRHPVCAYPWQPISFIRQTMLENSFSYIPVYMKENGGENGTWYIVSDYGIANYLRPAATENCRKELLSRKLEDAVRDNSCLMKEAVVVEPGKKVGEALDCAEGRPILVKAKDCTELLGIATPFDLM